MKETLSKYQVADALVNDEYAGWTRAGALALAEYMEQLEDDLGEEFELDVVALRCEYSEFESLVDWAEGYFADYKADLSIQPDADESEVNEAISEHIMCSGEYIEFDGGVIVSSF